MGATPWDERCVIAHTHDVGTGSATVFCMLATRVILFGVAVAQLTDALTFTVGVSRFGIALESNGIATWLFQQGGLTAVLLAKGAVLVATIALLTSTASRFPRLLVWGGSAATALGLLGFAANSASILILS